MATAIPLPELELPSGPAQLHAVEPEAAPRGLQTWLRAARIRQWPKNLLVFAAPAAAGVLTRPSVLLPVAATFGAFCLLASGAYLINDVRDAAEDRRHPVKRHRPVASGAIDARAALLAGAAAVLLGLGVSAVIGWVLLATALGYAALNVAYTTWLRRVAVADITTIAGAFLIRAVAGGVAANIVISRWFIVVVSFAALFVAAGKRYADLLDPTSRASRAVLREYNEEFLRLVLGVACAVALGAYCLWAFETTRHGGSPWRELTIAPFTMAMLRYGLVVSNGQGGAPEAALFGDRFIALAGVGWLALFAIGL
jgi:decaprenyl-phosphate phosphoribosyltransferase